jgi:hypothetical protein
MMNYVRKEIPFIPIISWEIVFREPPSKYDSVGVPGAKKCGSMYLKKSLLYEEQ